jgi:K+-transporting ATPase ATPase A chain
VLTGTAIALMSEAGRATIYNPSTHGFSEVLYAFSFAGNNNGSAFAGLGREQPSSTTRILGFAMLIARYWLAIPALAIAGSLANKKKVPSSAGTLAHAHSAYLFAWVIGVIVIVAR